MLDSRTVKQILLTDPYSSKCLRCGSEGIKKKKREAVLTSKLTHKAAIRDVTFKVMHMNKRIRRRKLLRCF